MGRSLHRCPRTAARAPAPDLTPLPLAARGPAPRARLSAIASAPVSPADHTPRTAPSTPPGVTNGSRTSHDGRFALLRTLNTGHRWIRAYDALTIEHIMPQSWRENWPTSAANEAEQTLAKQRRDTHLHRLGNLTLLNGSLNTLQSNAPWSEKRLALAKHSALRLNADLVTNAVWRTWDEQKFRVVRSVACWHVPSQT